MVAGWIPSSLLSYFSAYSTVLDVEGCYTLYREPKDGTGRWVSRGTATRFEFPSFGSCRSACLLPLPLLLSGWGLAILIPPLGMGDRRGDDILSVGLGCVLVDMDLTISHVRVSLCLRLMLDTGGVRFAHTGRSNFAIPTPRSWTCTTAILFASRVESYSSRSRGGRVAVSPAEPASRYQVTNLQ